MELMLKFDLNSRTLHLFSIYMLLLFGKSVSQSSSALSQANELFLDKLIDNYGTNGQISLEQLDKLLTQVQDTQNLYKSDNEHTSTTAEKISGSHQIQEPKNSSVTGVFHSNSTNTCPPVTQNTTECWTTQCLSAKEIFRFHNLAEDDRADRTQFRAMLPTLLYQLQNLRCSNASTAVSTTHKKPSAYEVWGYSFLCVTLINLCALTGVLFLPLMKKSIYQRLLVFMVALAVGTLAGSGLLFLIPDAFELSEETTHNYIYKATTIMGGIYLFFLLERIMKIIAEWRKSRLLPHEQERKKSWHLLPFDSIRGNKRRLKRQTSRMTFDVPKDEHHHRHRLSPCCCRASNGEDGVDINDVPVFSVIGKTTIDSDPNFKMSFKVPDQAAHGHGHSHGLVPVSESSMKLVKANGTPQDGSHTEQQNNGEEPANGDILVINPKTATPELPHKSAIKSVAWMVIFGDGVHNFIDGLSIGAAFTISTMTGFSVAIAVICEELPHELGDFAILLNSGMSMRQALMYNFLSACMCYLGLVFGIIAGETTSGATWIFALAGGMFLYISLVDMLPEVNHAAEEEAKNVCSQLKLLLVQNAGMLVGFGLMLLFAIYGEKIMLG